MNSVGRPRKYSSALVPLNLSVPDVYRDSIKEEAYKCNISLNEYVNALIVSADKDLAQELIKSMREMRAELVSKTEILDNTSKELVAFKANASNALTYLTARIEEDPVLDNLIRQSLSKYERLFKGLMQNTGTKEAVDEVVEKVYAEVELMLLTQGRAIKKPALLKILIKKNMVAPYA